MLFAAEPTVHRAVVLIVAYKSDAWLPDCCRTLASEVTADDLVMLVDNSGNTRIEACAALFPRAKIVRTERPLGFSEANNFGLIHGGLSGKYVCLLNQDTLSEPGWLGACLDVLEVRPDIGAVSPLLRTFDGAGWDEGFAACTRRCDRFARDEVLGQFEAVYEAPEVTAAAMVIRTSVLRRTGPFDPVFGSYYEDYDLCRRIRAAGSQAAICGRAAVRHYGGSTTTTPEAERRRKRLILRNRAIMTFRSAGPRRCRAITRYFSTTAPRNLLRGLFRTPSSQPVGAQLAALMDIMRLLPRMSTAARDEREWRAALKAMNWPDAVDEDGPAVEGAGPGMLVPGDAVDSAAGPGGIAAGRGRVESLAGAAGAAPGPGGRPRR